MNRRVLLVEGDDAVRDTFRTLSDAGYRIIEAGSVKTALMHIDVLDLSCIVLDLKLPNGHGRRVVEELQSKRDDVPVIILSNFHSDDEWGPLVVAVLDKPPSEGALLQAVEMASKQSEAIRALRVSTRKLRGMTGVV